MPPPRPTPIEEQIEEVEREIGKRERRDPGLVAAGKLTYPQSQRRLRVMRAVLVTLRQVQHDQRGEE